MLLKVWERFQWKEINFFTKSRKWYQLNFLYGRFLHSLYFLWRRQVSLELCEKAISLSLSLLSYVPHCSPIYKSNTLPFLNSPNTLFFNFFCLLFSNNKVENRDSMEEFGCLWSYHEVGHTHSSVSTSGSCFVCHLKFFFGFCLFQLKLYVLWAFFTEWS